VAGVAIAIGLFANFDVFRPLFQFSDLFILHWLMILAGFLILLWIILAKIPVVRSFFIILVPLLLGATNYWSFFNTNFPQHITNYLDEKFWDETGIRGIVIREPDVRPGKTNLTVKPFEIKKKGWKKWKSLSRKKGVLKRASNNILVQVKPVVGEYYETCDYGDIIEVHAALMIPMQKQNPGSFDYQEYLRSMWGTYACMYPRQKEQIKKLGENPGWLLKFALDMKKRMICTIKKTVPFPQSAFLGGVTLGTRGGVPPQMKFEFQATGVAHVLSVSGLHAMFIAILFVMLCSLFKIPPKPRWLIVSFSLLIFTLITGARPATMRAAIMGSMVLFFNAFGLSLRKSGSLTLPVSGCIILFLNPLLAPSASFVLSYIAVWSLIYLSGPIHAFFDKYIYSWFFIIFFFWTFLFTAVVCINPLLYKNGSFLLFIAAAVVLTIFAAARIEKIRPIESLSLNRIPPSLQGLVGFFYSQLAIQIGMMIPLSAVYFHRFPAAGVYANFIAIPLIGFIIMVGFLAGLIESLLSVIGAGLVGGYIALLLNTGNYWLTKMFTGVAHFFFKAFPYPFMPTLTLSWVVIYYSAVLAIAFYRPLMDIFETIKQRLKYLSREERILRISAIGVAIVLLVFLYNVKFGKRETGKFRLTVMAVGFGNCSLIRTPAGKYLLVDTTRTGQGEFNFQNLAAAFTLYHISSFENLILTNLKPENTGNAAQILPYFPAEKITTSYEPDKLSKKMPYQEFLNFLEDETLKEKWDGIYAQTLYTNCHFLVNAPLIPCKDYKRHTGLKKIFSARKGFPLYRTERGKILYSETVAGRDFIIRVLWPEKRRMAGTEDDLANNSIVLKITYGNFSMLVPSDIMNAAQEEMAEKFSGELKSDVLIAPYHGYMAAGNERWFSAVDPSLVIVPYIYDKGWSFYDSDLKPTIQLCRELGARILRLDKVGAVTIISDGTKFEWECVKTEKAATVGEASFEDALDVF